MVVTFQLLRLFALELLRREERFLIDERNFTGDWLIISQVVWKLSRSSSLYCVAR